MKVDVICSYCGKEYDTTESATGYRTHGICLDCKQNNVVVRALWKVAHIGRINEEERLALLKVVEEAEISLTSQKAELRRN